MPGRKPHPQKDAVADTPPPTSSSTLTKAERLLGTSGLAIGQLSRSKPQQPPSFASHSSFLDLTMSDEIVTDLPDPEAGPNSAIRNDASHLPRFRNLWSEASSDVLGAPQEDTGRTTSMTSRTTGQLRLQASSSTLKSYYDPKKFPPAISQQTSDSAIRDMALRKGKLPVFNTSLGALGEGGLEEEETEPEQNGRKRKPGLADLSRLFSKPSFGSLHLLTSPSQLSLSTDFLSYQAPSLRSKTSMSSIGQSYKSGNKLSKSRPTSPPKPGESWMAPGREEICTFKSNVRRPPRGVQNWFDGLLEEDDESDFEEEEEEEEARNPPISIQNRQERDVNVTIGGHRKPTFNPPNQLPNVPERPTLGTHRMSLKSQNSASSSRSRSSGMTRSNLIESSVISSSSSFVDEIGAEDNDIHLPPVRESVAISELGETIVIGKAQAFEVKPLGKFVNEHNIAPRSSTPTSILSAVTSSSSKPSSIGSGPHPIVPAQSRTEKTRHARQPSSIPEDGDETSKPSPSKTPHNNDKQTRSFQNEGHKLMAVTAEEEALLELMRRKRAAMAKHSFAEGYRTALQQENKRGRTPSRQRRQASQSSLGNVSALSHSKRRPSVIDNFPISNLQRSPLILASSLPSPPPTSPLPDPPIDPPSKRQSHLSQHTIASNISATSAATKRLSQLSSVSTVSVNGRIGAGALPNTKPSTPSPLKVDVSPITSSANDTDSSTTSSGSQASPLPSPMTPQTRCDSAEDTVMISSTRDTSPSPIELDSTEQTLLDETHLPTATDGKCCTHNHERTASGRVRIVTAPNSDETQELQRQATSHLLHSEDKSGRQTPLRTRASTLKQEVCVDRSSWRHSTLGPLTRCSVSEDVLTAWMDLGGWRGYGYYNVARI